MIHVRIEMWPLGDQSKARHMGTIEIANDGTGTREEGNYKVRLSRMDSPTRAWKSLAIKGFNRVTRGPHDLLLLALLSGVGQRNKRLIDQLKEEYGETPAEDGLTLADYEEVLADHRRLVREIDVLLNGVAGAAKQASLCDIVAQLRHSSRGRKDGETPPPAGPVPVDQAAHRATLQYVAMGDTVIDQIAATANGQTIYRMFGRDETLAFVRAVEFEVLARCCASPSPAVAQPVAVTKNLAQGADHGCAT
jgi:hypothetical protein